MKWILLAGGVFGAVLGLSLARAAGRATRMEERSREPIGIGAVGLTRWD